MLNESLSLSPVLAILWETGSVLCPNALWGCFGDVILFTFVITNQFALEIGSSLCFKATRQVRNMIFYLCTSKTHFPKKGFALRLVLKVRVFGTRKWSIRPTVQSPKV